jgi:adenylate kinase
MKLKDGKPLPDTMKDDITGELLIQRPDDTSDALVQRLKFYKEDTYPILNHYQPKGIVRSVNVNQGMNAVWEDVLQTKI